MIDEKQVTEVPIENEEEDIGKLEAKQANQLIALKKKTDKQLFEMKQMKEDIKPSVIDTPTKTHLGTVSYVDSGASKFLNKDKMRLVLMEKLHISREKADAIIDAGSTEKIIASYVKVTPA